MLREFSKITQLGSDYNGLIIKTYRLLDSNGEHLYTSEVDLKPGDKIVVDDHSIAKSVRRLQELIPYSLSCRRMVEGG